MLCTVLPEETALVCFDYIVNPLSLRISQILWYNKSRAESRVCPACQRLYRLGDNLQDLIDEEPNNKPPLPQLLREQKISGLCAFHAFLICLHH